MLKRIFATVLLVVLLPLCAHGAQESRMTPELAEKVLLECRRGDTFQILKGYNFTREEYEQMKMYLHDWQKYPMQDPDMGRDGEARFTLEMIVKDILGKLTYDAILECNFIKIREDENDLYYIVKNDDEDIFEIFLPVGGVIFDQKFRMLFKDNIRLKFYVITLKKSINAVKIMTMEDDNGYINYCEENAMCNPTISDKQILMLHRNLAQMN